MYQKHRAPVEMLLCILMVAVVANGGVGQLTKCILAFMAFLLNLILAGKSELREKRFVSSVSMGILAVLVVAIVAQSIRLPGNPLQNPIWLTAESSFPGSIGAISIAPEQTFSGIVTLAPILIFIAALKLCSERSDAVLIFRWIAYLTTVAAVWGLIEYLHLLDDLGLPPKQFYQDSLTSFFVNRNTAGTFFGLGILVWLYLCHSAQRLSGISFTQTLTAILNGRRILQDIPLVYLICAIADLVALALTQSRGAVASTGIAIAVYSYLVSSPRLRFNPISVGNRIVKRILQTAVVVVVVLIFIELFAAKALYRQEAGGVDQLRLCTYQDTLRIISDNWPLGSGFGTFSNIFPSYRNPECLDIVGTWEMAHNFFLEGVAGLGIVFCLVTVFAYVTLTWAFARGITSRSKRKKVAALGLSVLALITLHSLVDFSLQIPGVGNLVAALLGVCVSASLSAQSALKDSSAAPREQ